MKAEERQNDDLSLIPWDAENGVGKINAVQARLSRGLFRSEPAKWFPGFAMQWVPLSHSFGVEMRVKDVRPVNSMPEGLETGFVATVDDEPLGVYIDNQSATVLLEALSPGATRPAQSVLLEYLARRFITSLAVSWSGPESSVVRFDSSINPAQVRGVAAVKLDLHINNHPCRIWISLGRLLADRLDGLWKRQLRSTSRQVEGPLELALEVAQLAVPPSVLGEYLKPRAIVDLEVPVADKVILRNMGKPWAMARLYNIEDRFGFEIIDEPVPNPKVPQGSTVMSIVFGRIKLDGAQLSELSQTGAVWGTDIKLGPQVELIINNENVAQADLMVYEGRFAMRVR